MAVSTVSWSRNSPISSRICFCCRSSSRLGVVSLGTSFSTDEVAAFGATVFIAPHMAHLDVRRMAPPLTASELVRRTIQFPRDRGGLLRAFTLIIAIIRPSSARFNHAGGNVVDPG
jgi:hypothetical protein